MRCIARDHNAFRAASEARGSGRDVERERAGDRRYPSTSRSRIRPSRGQTIAGRVGAAEPHSERVLVTIFSTHEVGCDCGRLVERFDGACFCLRGRRRHDDERRRWNGRNRRTRFGQPRLQCCRFANLGHRRSGRRDRPRDRHRHAYEWISEPINLTLTGAPANVFGSGTIVGTASAGALNVSAASSASNGQTAAATVTAVSGTTSLTRTAALFVRVGHVLLIADTTTSWTVPADVNKITIVAWGSGGGGGLVGVGNAPGGAGGYCQADFPVAPQTSFAVVVGTGGAGCYLQTGLGGGGGGGYSAVALSDGGVDGATTYYVIAGAGGGGNAYNNGSAGQPGSGAEDAGGGNGFLTGYSGAGGGGGGAPGGGNGNSNGFGGGGGGYYGGGSGGGGSGFVATTATNIITNTGVGVIPPQLSSMFYKTNIAVGGTSGITNSTPGGTGGNGRVVILVAQ